MTKIDIFSGFLGAGKTTLIKKVLKEALAGTKVVLIENEFGQIGIDGGFLKDAGIEIKEMNQGCICCSLVGDFGTSLKEVIETYAPERILIEPSGVGKLSDVMKAVEDVKGLEVHLNSAVAVVDASKCKMYAKNFGEFFINQIEHAGTIVLSRTGKLSQEKIEAATALIREHNEKATIITTDWDELDGKVILETIEGAKDLEAELMAEVLAMKEEHHHHHDGECDDPNCSCHHHHDEEHEHHHHDGECDDPNCSCHHHHDEEHEHHHHDEEHEHHHHHDEEHEHHHHDEEHEHHHHHDEEHEHHHHHDEEHEHHHHHDGECDDPNCSCHHHHDHEGHHHADDVFTSWGFETPAKYEQDEIEGFLKALDDAETYGFVLRAKGMVPSADGSWIYFDYVPEETNVRPGTPDVTGKFCVIGSNLNKAKLEELFRK